MAEEWGNHLVLYLYDADGSPIGMQSRNTSYGEGQFDTYWFEKNLQGDIVAVYNQAGTKLISYTYDAWGNSSVSYYNSGVSTTATPPSAIEVIISIASPVSTIWTIYWRKK